MKPIVALYMGGMGAKDQNFHKQVFERMGYEAIAEQVQELYLAGDKDEATALIPDELVDDMHIIGTEAEVQDTVAAWEEHRRDDADAVVRALGDEIKRIAEVLACSDRGVTTYGVLGVGSARLGARHRACATASTTRRRCCCRRAASPRCPARLAARRARPPRSPTTTRPSSTAPTWCCVCLRQADCDALLETSSGAPGRWWSARWPGCSLPAARRAGGAGHARAGAVPMPEVATRSSETPLHPRRARGGRALRAARRRAAARRRRPVRGRLHRARHRGAVLRVPRHARRLGRPTAGCRPRSRGGWWPDVRRRCPSVAPARAGLRRPGAPVRPARRRQRPAHEAMREAGVFDGMRRALDEVHAASRTARPEASGQLALHASATTGAWRPPGSTER